MVGPGAEYCSVQRAQHGTTLIDGRDYAHALGAFLQFDICHVQNTVKR